MRAGLRRLQLLPVRIQLLTGSAFERHHRIGGLVFRTSSRIPLPRLEEPCYARFECPAGRPSVTNLVFETGGPRSAPEPGFADLLRSFRADLPAGGGRQLLPLLVPAGTERPAPSPESPLLGVAEAREIISRALEGADPERTALLLHLMTIEIRDFARRTATVLVAPGFRALLDTPQAGQSLRMLFSLFLPSCGRFLLHCAAVRLGRAAVALLAPDSGGKSTAASLAPAGAVICDDRAMVSREGGRFVLHPTPWNQSGEGSCSELSAVVLLSKGPGFTLAPAAARDAAAFAWADNMHFFRDIPRGDREMAFDLVGSMCSSVPCLRMTFAPDRIDWDALAGVAGG